MANPTLQTRRAFSLADSRLWWIGVSILCVVALVMRGLGSTPPLSLYVANLAIGLVAFMLDLRRAPAPSRYRQMACAAALLCIGFALVFSESRTLDVVLWASLVVTLGIFYYEGAANRA